MRSKATMRRSLALSAAAVLLIGLTACGGGDSGDKESGKADGSDKNASAPTSDAGPKLPAASADLLVPDYDTTGLTGKAVQPGALGEVRLPGLTLRIDNITEIASTVLEEVETGPADGEALRVVTWTTVPDADFVGTAPKVSAFLEDGGARTNLFDDATTASPFLVSVGKDARLAFAADGHEVRVALDTGARDADQISEVYYREPIRQDLGKPLTFTTARSTVEGEAVEVPYAAVLDTVELSPYLPVELTGGAAKWASEGKTFLLVRVSGTAATGPGCCPGWSVTSTRQTWTATIAGQPYQSTNTVEFDEQYSDQSEVAIFEVPANTAEVALEVAARSAVTGLKDKVLAHGKLAAEATFGSPGTGSTPTPTPSATTSG